MIVPASALHAVATSLADGREQVISVLCRRSIQSLAIVGSPILDQYLAEYKIANHQGAKLRPMLGLILIRKSMALRAGPIFNLMFIHQPSVYHYGRNRWAIIRRPIIGLPRFNQSLGHPWSANCWFANLRPILRLSLINQTLVCQLKANTRPIIEKPISGMPIRHQYSAYQISTNLWCANLRPIFIDQSLVF